MRIWVVPVLILCGCQSGGREDRQHPEPDACVTEGDAVYSESLDAEANAAALDNFSESRIETLPSYDRSLPSNLDWKIVDGRVRFDGKEYSLSYSKIAAYWSVLNDDEVMVGNLTPYRTALCGAVSQLKLIMFIPSEEATASLRFQTL